MSVISGGTRGKGSGFYWSARDSLKCGSSLTDSRWATSSNGRATRSSGVACERPLSRQQLGHRGAAGACSWMSGLLRSYGRRRSLSATYSDRSAEVIWEQGSSPVPDARHDRKSSDKPLATRDGGPDGAHPLGSQSIDMPAALIGTSTLACYVLCRARIAEDPLYRLGEGRG